MFSVNTKPYHLPENATWLITGCSSGIGREIATLVSTKPHQRLIATARDPSTLSYIPSSSDNPNILKLALDVTSPSSIDAAFAAAEAHFGACHRIDVVVNNAGYSLSGDTESATVEEMHEQLETNFFGTVRVTMRAVKVMRQQEEQGMVTEHGRRGGLVFNISSVAGVCAFPGHAFYHASKFAVEGWTESVAKEMNPDWNINFCIVQPSAVKTNFEGHSKKNTAPHEAYASPDMPARKLDLYVRKGLEAGMGITEPADVAELLFKVAGRGEKVPLRLPVSSNAFGLIKGGLEGRLKDLEGVKESSLLGES